MTPHRDDRETLLAENERLRAEVASLRAKPAKAPKTPLRWDVPAADDNDLQGFVIVPPVMGALVFVVAVVAWLFMGWDDMWAAGFFRRTAGLGVFCAVAWCLSLVRRVPR